MSECRPTTPSPPFRPGGFSKPLLQASLIYTMPARPKVPIRAFREPQSPRQHEYCEVLRSGHSASMAPARGHAREDDTGDHQTAGGRAVRPLQKLRASTAVGPDPSAEPPFRGRHRRQRCAVGQGTCASLIVSQPATGSLPLIPAAATACRRRREWAKARSRCAPARCAGA